MNVNNHADANGLKFEGVTKRFTSTVALEDFSLDVAAGELISLLGPSGCGKTTALRIAAGFETLDNGAIFVGSRTITHVAPNHRNMGMVFQSYSLFPHLTVLENVAFGLKMRRMPGQTRHRLAAEMLELVRLSNLNDRYPHQLSGGQQQRVALARALAFRPSVLLLDEPLSALDAKVREEVRDEIRHLNRTLGTTTIFVTHDQAEALEISDRICVMNKGRVEQIGTPTEIYDHPTNDFVARFVGMMNLIDLNGVFVRVRPEQIVLRLNSTSGTAATIENVTFHGSFVRSVVKLADGQRVTVDGLNDPDQRVTPGQAVHIEFSALERNPN